MLWAVLLTAAANAAALVPDTDRDSGQSVPDCTDGAAERGRKAGGGTGWQRDGIREASCGSRSRNRLPFMRRCEDEALYGGAAGGGKSDALVIETLRQVDVPHYRGLIVRKTYPQLSELIDKTMQYYRPAFPKARYNASSQVDLQRGEDLFWVHVPHAGTSTTTRARPLILSGWTS